MSVVTAYDSLTDRICDILGKAVFRKSAFNYINEHNRRILELFQSYCVPGSLCNISSPAGFNIISVMTPEGTRNVNSAEMEFFYCIFILISGCTDMGYEFRKLHDLDYHLHEFFNLMFGIKKRTPRAFVPHVSVMLAAFRERPFAASKSIHGDQRDFQLLVDAGFITAEMHLLRHEYMPVVPEDDDDETNDASELDEPQPKAHLESKKRPRALEDAMDEIEYLKKRNARLQALAETRTSLCCDYFDVLGLDQVEVREEFQKVGGSLKPKVLFFCSDDFIEGRVAECDDDDVDVDDC